MLVIDEAQDMGTEEHALVKALMANNEEMRVIVVGDDDQNIYEIPAAPIQVYMYRLAQEKRKYICRNDRELPQRAPPGEFCQRISEKH